MTQPIVLIGPMGVGKTTIGKKLAKRLGLPFLDTDSLIVKEHGSIPKIFERSGEAEFRKLETIALQTALDQGGVVATGGGVVLQAENRELLKRAYVIYLSTNGRHIGARLLSGKRPLIKNGVADWKRIYEERKPLYLDTCDVEVSTSGKALGAIVEEITELVGAND
jgi:shikimate kinase